MKRASGWTGSLTKILVIAIMAGGVALLVSNFLGLNKSSRSAVVEPTTLSPLAVTGKALFEKSCKSCHGARGGGTDNGPPFVHDIYNPGHHPDEAFIFAAQNGVRAHHWKFGNMPPIAGVSGEDVRAIVQYVRELQQANGIAYRPHTM